MNIEVHLQHRSQKIYSCTYIFQLAVASEFSHQAGFTPRELGEPNFTQLTIPFSAPKPIFANQAVSIGAQCISELQPRVEKLPSEVWT